MKSKNKYFDNFTTANRSDALKMYGLFLLLLLSLLPTYTIAESSFDIGIFPRRGADVTIKMFQPLAIHLEQELGQKVKLHVYKDYDHFREALFTRNFDLVHLNHYLYLKAHKDYQYDIIAMNEEFGRNTLSSALFTHVDSGIETVEQLRGKKIVFGGGKDAFIAYIANRYLLEQHGLNPGDYIEDFAINPPNALLSAYFRRADAGGAGDIAPQIPVVKKMIDPSKVRILIKSEPLPHIPWALKRELTPEIKKKVQMVLTTLGSTNHGKKILKSMKLTGMSHATDNDYEIARSIIENVHGQLD